jgi:putative endonuclease
VVECSDGSYYTGWTTDPERRIKAHNAGRGARYTRSRRPVRLVYIEPQDDQAGAMKREHAIKAMSRPRKQRLIHGYRAGDLHRQSRKPRSIRKRKTDGRSR